MSIKKLFEEQIESEWNQKSKVLKERIKESYERLNTSLSKQKSDPSSEDHGYGEFANDILDSEMLTNIVSRKKGKGLSPERSEGITRAKTILRKYSDNNYEKIPNPQLIDFSWAEEPEEFLSVAEKFYNPFQEIFLALRIADFEKNSSYTKFPELYKRENLSWGKITRQEWELVPPLVACQIKYLLNPTELLLPLTIISSKSYPIKLILLENEIPIPDRDLDEEEYITSMIPTDLSLLVPGLQKVHYFQSPAEIENEHFVTKMKQLLYSTGLTLVRLYTGNLSNYKENNVHRASLSRYIPWFDYDPHKDFNFSSCVSIDESQQIGEFWGKELIEYGKFSEERFITFADFVCQQGFSPSHFTEPSPQERRRSLDLSKFLELETWNRQHYYPIVKDLEGKPKIPSRILVALTAERARIWKTLQNWSGIGIKQIEEKIAELKVKFEEEKSKEIAKKVAEKEKESQVILNNAFQNLVNNLLSDDVEKNVEQIIKGIRSGEQPTTIPQITPNISIGNGHIAQTTVLEKVETDSSDVVWIDTPQFCTACDECITINRNIFAYNSEKQAYVKNPKGGPFRDIVKAAEKCGAGIIRPGKPLDPNEKGLEKLIKRAEKYN